MSSPPHEVIVAALTQALPEQHDHVHARARLIHLALVDAGHLPNDDVTRETLREGAHRSATALAAASAHPRFIATSDGWRQIVGADADGMAKMAHREAVKQSPSTRHEALAQQYDDVLAENHRLREERS